MSLSLSLDIIFMMQAHILPLYGSVYFMSVAVTLHVK